MRKRTVFGGKIEAAPGTKETLTVTQAAFNVYDLEIETDTPVDERSAQGSAGTQRSTIGGHKGKATFKIDLGFDGLVVPTYADLLFPCCGLFKTGNVFAPKTQTPDTAGAVVKTATIGKWMDGKYECIYGAMGTFKLVLPTAKTPYFEFEFEGVYGGESDVALPAPTYPADTKLRCAGGPLAWDSVPLCLESMTFDLANVMYVKQCSTTIQGYDLAMVSDRKPKVTANPESKLVAGQARQALLLAGTEKALRYVVPAPGYDSLTGAKSFEFLAPKAQLITKKEIDREGMAADDLTFQINNSLIPDSDFTLTFNI